MGWEDLLADRDLRVLPWTGGRKVARGRRAWKIRGELPAEHGWYSFEVSGGRWASVAGEAEPDPDGFEQGHPTRRGYLVGNRLIPDDARVDPDPARLVEQTVQVYLVEPGLERFSRVATACSGTGDLVYLRREFPEGPELEVQEAYQDRKPGLDHVTGVTPALDLAFRWISYQRYLAEERQLQRELEQERREQQQQQELERQQRRQEALLDGRTGAGRRALAAHDFEAAARAALQISGAELLDTRDSCRRGEVVVQYRYRRHRLECVVARHTLQVVDAGVCLEDHDTGEKGDTLLTLESLPPVIEQAMDEGRLVIWRHA